MKPVVQAEATGCGIAAVATILGKNYPEMKAIAGQMDIFADDESLWSETDYVREMLAKFNITTSTGETAFTSWQALPDLALLAIKHHRQKDKNYWHWVVFKRDINGEAVFDSASSLDNNIRTDFENMQPKWFIEVSI